MSIKYLYSAGEVINSFSPNTYTGLLAANTEQTLAVPNITSQCASSSTSQKIVAIISVMGVSPLWASTATVAVPTTTIGSSSGELVTSSVPLKKIVKYGDTLHFISSVANTQFGVTFYVSY